MALRAAAVLAVLALALAGCSGGAQGLVDWSPLPCDPAKADERNVVKGKEPSPSGDMGELARRFGQALGDAVSSSTPVENPDGRQEWKTGAGVIRTRHSLDPDTLLEYEANRKWPGLDAAAGRAAIEQFATAFGYPGTFNVTYRAESSGQFAGKIEQTMNGRVVGQMVTLFTYVERSDSGTPFVRVLLRPFWVLPSESPRINEQDAQVIAQKFLRCELDEVGRTAAKGYEHRYTGLLFQWLPLHNRSISYVVESQYHNPVQSKCPSADTFATMYVDVWTGAVLTWDWNRCGIAAPTPTPETQGSFASN